MNITICAHKWIKDASDKLIACQKKSNNTIYNAHTELEIANNEQLFTHKLYDNQRNNADQSSEQVYDSINNGENFFSSGISNHEEARREATIIFCHCLGIDKIQLRLEKQFLLTETQHTQLTSYLARRIDGEPIAYIFGHKEFFGIDFMVDEHVLIPRPETEFIVEEALHYDKNKPLTILDLGCGSACIALSILKNKENWRAVLVDISPEALAVARKNAINLNLEKRVHFVLGDFSCKNFQKEFALALKSKRNLFNAHTNSQMFDIILSNPPYIPEEEYQQLHTSVKNYEPKIALISHLDQAISTCDNTTHNANTDRKTERISDIDNGKNLIDKGLLHIQAIIHLAEKMLKPEGLLLIEHGYNQAQDCRKLCNTKFWASVCSGKDYSHIERYLKAFRKKD